MKFASGQIFALVLLALLAGVTFWFHKVTAPV